MYCFVAYIIFRHIQGHIGRQKLELEEDTDNPSSTEVEHEPYTGRRDESMRFERVNTYCPKYCTRLELVRCIVASRTKKERKKPCSN